MIKNDKQYQITKTLLTDFKKTLEEILNETDESIDPIYKKIEEDSVKGQIKVFEKEISDYEFLKQGEANFICVDSISNLHELLIKARILKGWTHAELARRLDLKEQQIQRYEFSNYSTASIARVNQVASVLDINNCPFKIKLSKQPVFTQPQEYDDEMISNAFQKMKINRCFISI